MRRVVLTIALAGFVAGCAGAPVRPALREDPGVPPGTIEGDRFTGIRYPFRVSAPPHWRMATQFPGFLEKLGYNRPLPTDPERTELYAYNPRTNSHVQFDLTPAGPYATFSQETIQVLTSAATESLRSELDEEHGKGAVVPDIGPTEPASLRGVPFAARKRATYAVRGEEREQGWIYGFAEPYQIFILYLIVDPAGSNDRDDIGAIVDSFEFVTGK